VVIGAPRPRRPRVGAVVGCVAGALDGAAWGAPTQNESWMQSAINMITPNIEPMLFMLLPFR
jgi:hypothetical protein